MSTPYIGEIRAVSFNFAPKGWSGCNGQLLAIQSNQALFSLLGVNFGGNGSTNFALPDMRGRTPVGIAVGPGPSSAPYQTGNTAGAETVSLSLNELPAHNHNFMGSTADATSPIIFNAATKNSTVATANAVYYNKNTPDTALYSGSVGAAGGSQPHNNIQPSLALMYVIALNGIFPSRN